MAATAGGEDIQEPSSVTEKTTKPPNTLQQNADKIEDVSTNGTVSSCSQFSEARRSTSLLRPSVFSSHSPTSSKSAFGGSNVSSSFGSSPSSFGSSPTKTPFSLRPSVFGSATNPDSSNSASKRPVLLRASQLESICNSPVSSTTNTTNSAFVLSPAKLNNPLYKTVSEDKSEDGCSSTVTSVEENKTSNSESEKSNTSNSTTDTLKVSFVPLASTNNPGSSQSLAPSAVSTTIPSFVFGQNLHERVEGPAEPVRSEAESSDVVITESRTSDCDVSKTNGATPEMLFSSVIQQELSDKQAERMNDERKRKSLSEAAREYEESRAIKRKYEEVTVKTGEEEEINILQINCKLFAFNKEKSTWVERGRGTLRLNDLSLDNRTQSRVVMRVSGSLRVVLNTKIWAEMTVDRPSEKSVRLTAMDGSGEIKVFLVMAGVKEIDQLFKALEWRVNNQKKMASTCEKSLETNES